MNFPLINLAFYSQTNTKKESLNIPIDFQNCIKQGNTDLLTKLISDGAEINTPLPNGEMPLHFAVRSNKQEVVVKLMEKGANLEAKDFQNLSAIDHVFLMNNEEMLVAILGKKIGSELQQIQKQMNCKGAISHVTQLKSAIQKKLTMDLKNLKPINKASFEGNIDALSNEMTAETINVFDDYGLAPIHYAILGNQPAAFEKLVELGSKINRVNQEGDSLLHFAAMSGSTEILNQLISLKVDFDQKNSNGITALHYAAAKENLGFVEILVKAGANPHILDNEGMSPLALIGTSALQRDPLSLPKTQVILFVASSLFWLSMITSAIQGDSVFTIIAIGSLIATSWIEFALALASYKEWKPVLSSIVSLGCLQLPILNLGLQVWKTYHVAHSAFEGLKKCWRNVGYRNWAVARNVLVYAVNTANSFHNLQSYFKTPVNERQYNRQYNYQYKRQDDVEVKCPEINPSTLVGLSTLERLNKSELKNECPEHALAMISPALTFAELKVKGASLYKKDFRKLMKEIHPDKAASSQEIARAVVRLNAASDTLKKWLEENKVGQYWQYA